MTEEEFFLRHHAAGRDMAERALLTYAGRTPCPELAAEITQSLIGEMTAGVRVVNRTLGFDDPSRDSLSLLATVNGFNERFLELKGNPGFRDNAGGAA